MNTIPGGKGEIDKRVEALVTEHQARLRAFLFSRTGDEEVSYDLAQEVFLVFLRKLDEFDSSRSLWPWLVGIARNKLNEYWREHAKETPVDSIESFADSCQIDDEESESGVWAHERRIDALKDCLSKLSPFSRKLLDMTYGENLRGEDIAAQLGKRAIAVRVALHRTRSWLARCIARSVEVVSA
jgi:RNA polymerase sigma-70 factor (ECF subfamily)